MAAVSKTDGREGDIEWMLGGWLGGHFPDPCEGGCDLATRISGGIELERRGYVQKLHGTQKPLGMIARKREGRVKKNT